MMTPRIPSPLMAVGNRLLSLVVQSSQGVLGLPCVLLMLEGSVTHRTLLEEQDQPWAQAGLQWGLALPSVGPNTLVYRVGRKWPKCRGDRLLDHCDPQNTLIWSLYHSTYIWCS
jgi:hypothetical protein